MSDYFIEGWSEKYGVSMGGYTIYKDGKVVYKTEVGESINAVHCFLGICHAKFKYNNDLFSNNKTAISWFNNKKVNCSHEGLIERIEKAEAYLNSEFRCKCDFLKKDEYFEMVKEKQWLRDSLTFEGERIKLEFDEIDNGNDRIVKILKDLNYKAFGFLEYIKIIGCKGCISVEYKSSYDNEIKLIDLEVGVTTTEALYMIGNLERKL